MTNQHEPGSLEDLREKHAWHREAGRRSAECAKAVEQARELLDQAVSLHGKARSVESDTLRALTCALEGVRYTIGPDPWEPTHAWLAKTPKEPDGA
jgi:hypothetical protein